MPCRTASMKQVALLLVVLLLSGTVAYCSNPCENCVIGTPQDTRPIEKGAVTIQGVGTFEFDPTQVQTVRPDLFNAGYFSLFDLLVHLSKAGKIRLTYHFDQQMDTHVIDALNGSANWWYTVWYHGGWRERSVHRMDYYPVKDKMQIDFTMVDRIELERRYKIWRTEVSRRAANDGKIIVPEVRIIYEDKDVTFKNVVVTPYNLRNDMLVKDTITAADVIMSLADQGKISYQFLWYENIGSAKIKNYYVECINKRCHSGMCGFVYEAGEIVSSGNHIHLQTDIRILQSPEYVLFYWIVLGPCFL